MFIFSNHEKHVVLWFGKIIRSILPSKTNIRSMRDKVKPNPDNSNDFSVKLSLWLFFHYFDITILFYYFLTLEVS